MNLRVSVAVRAISKYWVTVVFLCLFGCSSPSVEDKERLEKVEQQFGDRYVFMFKDHSYLHAVLKENAVFLQQDAVAIYMLFRFNDFEERKLRQTAYVNLNMYDSKGNFLFQLGYDAQTGKLARGTTEHY
ncbi:MAG: hypothetical protein RDU13_03100 [Elusimicrobiales bacterium]|nr:hypothetical protein [Elusimicrobiales bacterium]